MFNFWLFCLFLLFLACLFLLLPALRFIKKSRSAQSASVMSEAQRRKENVRIFKERVQELEQDKAAGVLSEESFAQMFAELEASLLNDVNVNSDSADQPEEPNSQAPLRANYLYTALALTFLIVFSLWFYQKNGALEQVAEYNAQQFTEAELEQAKELARQGDMNALLKQLHTKLKQSPDNLEGWQLLARSAMNSQQFDYAIEAYQEMIRLVSEQGENPAALYGLLAQAKYYQTDGRIDAEIDAILRKALSLDANELNSLGLLAIDAFSAQRYQEAKTLWRRILEIYPEHPARTSIEAGIQRAEAELGLAGGTISSAEQASLPVEESAANSATSSPANSVANYVDVQVSIDPLVLEQVSPQAAVFVIARNANPPAGQPNLPLAVSKYRVSDLPVTVRLDDSKAMSPMAKLSSAETVAIIARVSPSGSPLPQPGDFEAVSADIQPGDQATIALKIQTKLQ